MQPDTPEVPAEQPAANQTASVSSPEPAASPAPQKAKHTKRNILIALIVLVLVGTGAYVLYAHNKKKAPAASSSSTTNATTQQTNTKPIADNVVYYTKTKDTDPYVIYTRPATGGERQAAYTLSGKVDSNYYNIGSTDVRGQNVIFAAEDGIYISQDSGKTFKNIYKLDPAKSKENQAITSMGFTVDGKKVVFALLPSLSDASTAKNTVKTISLDGQGATDVHSFDAAGVFVYSYNSDTQELIYATGCYFCDGRPKTPRLMNTKTNSDKELFSVNNDTEIYNGSTASQDGSKLIYYLGTNSQDAANEFGGIGWQGAPPYKVMQIDVSSGQSTVLATIGTAHEKDSSGKFKVYFLTTGFTTDSGKPFYTADNKLYTVNSSTPSLTFEATKTINSAPYVTGESLFAEVDSSTNSNGDYTFYRYEPTGSKTTSIFQGDVNTRVIGVTYK